MFANTRIFLYPPTNPDISIINNPPLVLIPVPNLETDRKIEELQGKVQNLQGKLERTQEKQSQLEELVNNILNFLKTFSKF